VKNDLHRSLIAKWSSPLAQVRVYHAADGFDIVSNEHFEVVHTHIFFEDIQLITIHRERGKLYLILTGLAAFGFLGLGAFLLLLPRETWSMAGCFGVLGVPFIIAFLIRALVGVDIVTIFGRRSKAKLRFKFRKRRAREIYGQICATVRHQQHLAAPPVIREESPVPLPPDLLPPLPPSQ